jgi:hypothetical protein
MGEYVARGSGSATAYRAGGIYRGKQLAAGQRQHRWSNEVKPLGLPHISDTDAKVDLINGARQRLGAAAWNAKQAVEQITYANKDPLTEINNAERWLEIARGHAEALLTLSHG